LGYKVKYFPNDSIYIEKHIAGEYSFEYYFEFNGLAPNIYIYIKRSEKDWPLSRYAPGFAVIHKAYPPKDIYDFSGYFLFPRSLNDLPAIFTELKPMLDDLRKAIVPYLEKDELDFNVDPQ
jgi:hypothetical protein